MLTSPECACHPIIHPWFERSYSLTIPSTPPVSSRLPLWLNDVVVIENGRGCTSMREAILSVFQSHMVRVPRRCWSTKQIEDLIELRLDGTVKSLDRLVNSEQASTNELLIGWQAIDKTRG